jgi:hypothetical protein
MADSRWRKKPVVVEARQLTTQNGPELCKPDIFQATYEPACRVCDGSGKLTVPDGDGESATEQACPDPVHDRQAAPEQDDETPGYWTVRAALTTAVSALQHLILDADDENAAKATQALAKVDEIMAGTVRALTREPREALESLVRSDCANLISITMAEAILTAADAYAADEVVAAIEIGKRIEEARGGEGQWLSIAFMGHVELTGYVTEITLGGQPAFHVDLPEKLWGGNPMAWQEYAGSALYSRRPVAEASARAAWEAQRARAARRAQEEAQWHASQQRALEAGDDNDGEPEF